MTPSRNTAARSTAPEPAPPDHYLEDLACLCKASADPLRLQILRVLRSDSFGVSELCAIFDMRQPALSHHLKVLAGAGMVASRREGNSIFYRRSELGQPAAVEALQNQIFEAADRIELAEPICRRLLALQRRREQNSRDFFRDNAHKFQQQQDLIASYRQYAATVEQVLRDAPLRRRRTALEVGPGDGSFLPVLAADFRRVVALDNAPSMLERARATVRSAGAGNVEFILGDTTSAQLTGLQADCAVINMVLHHTPSPAQMLRDVAARLVPGAVVLVTDLCRHHQAWARENCGDLWLGFEPADLGNWAAAAGLTDIACVYLAQRNGFQIQVRLFGRP